MILIRNSFGSYLKLWSTTCTNEKRCKHLTRRRESALGVLVASNMILNLSTVSVFRFVVAELRLTKMVAINGTSKVAQISMT